MKTSKISLIAWGAVAAAVIAWVLAAMFVWSVFSQENARSASAFNAEQVTAQETASLRLHALARDTKSAREELDALTNAEVLGIADLIEGVGKSAGVKIKINGADPESSQQTSKSQTLHAINFQVETEGTFAPLMHAVILFENMPALSSIQSLELERVQNFDGSDKNKKALWRLNAKIKVMTTADI